MIKAKNMGSGSRNTRDISGKLPASFYLDDSEPLEEQHNAAKQKSQAVASGA